MTWRLCGIHHVHFSSVYTTSYMISCTVQQCSEDSERIIGTWEVKIRKIIERFVKFNFLFKSTYNFIKNATIFVAILPK